VRRQDKFALEKQYLREKGLLKDTPPTASDEVRLLKQAVRELYDMIRRLRVENQRLTKEVEDYQNDTYEKKAIYCETCKRRLSRTLPVCPVCHPDYYERLHADYLAQPARESEYRKARYHQGRQRAQGDDKHEGDEPARDGVHNVYLEGVDFVS